MSAYMEMNFCYAGTPPRRGQLNSCIPVREMHIRIKVFLQGLSKKSSIISKLSPELVYKILDSMDIHSYPHTRWSSFLNGGYKVITL